MNKSLRGMLLSICKISLSSTQSAMLFYSCLYQRMQIQANSSYLHISDVVLSDSYVFDTQMVSNA